MTSSSEALRAEGPRRLQIDHHSEAHPHFATAMATATDIGYGRCLADIDPVFGRLTCRDGTMDINERMYINERLVRDVLIVGMTGMLDR